MSFVTLHGSIAEAATLVRQNHLVAFPTETVYGLGANALNAEAVQKIYALKGRPPSNPLILHVSCWEDISPLADLTDPQVSSRLTKVRHLMPGPLSVVVPKAASACIPDIVTAGGNTIAVRVPAHPVAIALLKAAQCPLAAPSANRTTRVSPTTAEHVRSEFGEKVYILDGGATSVGLESTVVSLIGERPRLLRPGGVTREILEKVLGESILIGEASESGQPVQSPGLSTLHYAPVTPVVFAGNYAPLSSATRAGLITFQKNSSRNVDFPYVTVKPLSTNGNLEEAAQGLYAALRELDAAELDVIVVEQCSETGIGAAIMDRLRRATAQR
jgi:L-threonylcarbamoyladenylate synthase